MAATVSPLVTIGACQGCGACLLTCPVHAIRPAGGRLIVLDQCTGCGECVEVCPVDVIAMSDEVGPEIGAEMGGDELP